MIEASGSEAESGGLRLSLEVLGFQRSEYSVQG